MNRRSFKPLFLLCALSCVHCGKFVALDYVPTGPTPDSGSQTILNSGRLVQLIFDAQSDVAPSVEAIADAQRDVAPPRYPDDGSIASDPSAIWSLDPAAPGPVVIPTEVDACTPSEGLADLRAAALRTGALRTAYRGCSLPLGAKHQLVSSSRAHWLALDGLITIPKDGTPPKVVDTGEIAGLAVNGDDCVWIKRADRGRQGSADQLRTVTASGAVVVLAEADSGFASDAIAAYDDDLYWSGYLNGRAQLTRLRTEHSTVTTGTTSVVYAGPGHLDGIAADASGLYYALTVDGTASAIYVQVGSEPSRIVGSFAPNLGPIATNRTEIFFRAGSHIYSMNKATGDVHDHGSVETSLWADQIVADDDHVYTIAQDPCWTTLNTVYSASLPDGALTPLYVFPEGVLGITMDQHQLTLASQVDSGSCLEYRLYTLPIDVPSVTP